ncbi:MAG: hypothetical protein KGI50_01090 [Patescibacteria group bacterium]|nr:hypothetical protein [Patescibacteria group bacterium]MDE2438053.1 hypothetical protein [Patescibacteria group bacterium]
MNNIAIFFARFDWHWIFLVPCIAGYAVRLRPSAGTIFVLIASVCSVGGVAYRVHTGESLDAIFLCTLIVIGIGYAGPDVGHSVSTALRHPRTCVGLIIVCVLAYVVVHPDLLDNLCTLLVILTAIWMIMGRPRLH